MEGRRRRGRQRMRWLDRIMDSKDMTFTKLRERGEARSLVCCGPWGCKESEAT